MLDRTRNFVTARHHALHVPRTMFAAAIDRFGGPEVITPHALPIPAVDAGEVLIASGKDILLPANRISPWFSASTALASSQPSARGCGG
jgi:hypothetical protein